MPLVPDPNHFETLKETQNNCKLCDEEASCSNHVTVCDICTMWVCLDCSEVTEDVYNHLAENNVKLNFVCPVCQEDLKHWS